ncbi:Aspartate racemase-like protein [Drosera capensis]
MNLRAISTLDHGIAMRLHTPSYPRVVMTRSRSSKSTPLPQTTQLSVQPIQSSKKPSEFKKLSSTFADKTVGIIGGVSVISTIAFVEKLVTMSSRDGEECLPFILSSDPSVRIGTELSRAASSQAALNGKGGRSEMDFLVDNLRRKRKFLGKSGARCIVMPCHVLHAWHKEISEGCSLPFLHVGDCVAKELREADMKPIEAGSTVKIGVIATDETLTAGYYQDKLQNEGFEVVLPDKATMEHIVNPAIEAMHKRDMEGARNLLTVAIHILLVRAVNTVILASDELQGLLPRDDPLLKKCIDPMDALARSTISWGKEASQSTSL